MSPRGDRTEPVLSLVERLPGGWQEAPGRRYCPSRHLGEVIGLRREATALEEVVADLTLENRLLKKGVTGERTGCEVARAAPNKVDIPDLQKINFSDEST